MAMREMQETTFKRVPMSGTPQRMGLIVVTRAEPAIEWREYDRIRPGIYAAYSRARCYGLRSGGIHGTEAWRNSRATVGELQRW